MASETYLGNPRLKSVGQPVEWTEESVLEYKKCMEYPEHCIKEYVKVIHVDKGLIPFDMYPYQQKMIQTFMDNRFVICKMPRQSGKSTTIISFLLHYILFNENVQCAVLANKLSTARELLGRLQLAYENLPKWMQQGIGEWNKGSIELENGSKLLASATSSPTCNYSAPRLRPQAPQRFPPDAASWFTATAWKPRLTSSSASAKIPSERLAAPGRLPSERSPWTKTCFWPRI